MSKAAARRLIDQVPNAGRREDALVLLDLMHEVTGETPEVWGSMIGFGRYHYVYESGREGDSFIVGFAPRKANLVVYIMPGFEGFAGLLDRLGKFRTGSSCLYLGRLKAIDLDVLRQLVDESVAVMRERYHQ